MAALVLVGLAAYPLLPVAPLPRVDFPTIHGDREVPGASPDTMAAAVAQPLETAVRQIAGIAQMTSVSVLGRTRSPSSSISTVTSTARRGDVLAAINAARDAAEECRAAELPEGQPVRSADHDPGGPVGQLPVIEVDDYAENMLAQQISQMSGVAQVIIAGQQKRAIRVQVDPAQARRDGAHAGGCARASLATPPRRAEGHASTAPHTAYTVYANDQLHQGRQYNDVIVAYRNGAPVRIRDIGRAIDGPAERSLAAWQNGHRGVILLIFKQPGANVIDTVERDQGARCRDCEATIPPAIKVDDRGRPHADHPRLGR